jgi:hypothetical protein
MATSQYGRQFSRLSESPRPLGTGASGAWVDHHYQLHRELHRQVTRRGAVQDFVHERDGAAEAPAQIDAIADQPTVIDMFAIAIDSWLPVRRHQRRNVICGLPGTASL